MFSRLAVASLFALPLLAAASSGSCSTGPVQCCQSVESSNSAVVSTILKSLGVDLQGVVAQVGLQCSPISVVGAGGSTCKAQSVCCENNNVGGAVSIGCAPVSL
ncbi:fungal hydrophobin [Daedaleopsis nitida]|nr:fungal hydrophobin [Daedaleopsis nitida]